MTPVFFKISHHIRFTYSAPVFHEPHILRLRPRCGPFQQIERFALTLEPEPAGIQDFLDSEGNHAACLWFENTRDFLSLSTLLEVKTLCVNPFAFLVTDPAFLKLPVRYERREAAALLPFLVKIDSGETVKAFGKALIFESKGSTLDFLSLLNTRIHQDVSVVFRGKSPPKSPTRTLKAGRGACRDLAWLFMAVCRNVGLASRFVSGYQEGDPVMDQRHLHAWAEVFIPGGGWRGYDPTLGLTVADRHIAVAASSRPAGAAPVTGRFRGTGVSARMSYSIALSALPE